MSLILLVNPFPGACQSAVVDPCFLLQDFTRIPIRAVSPW